jgi:pyrimidine nucleoside transport protein
LIEAASNGAQQSIKLVANIGVNLIAFIALLQFINATLTFLTLYLYTFSQDIGI